MPVAGYRAAAVLLTIGAVAAAVLFFGTRASPRPESGTSRSRTPRSVGGMPCRLAVVADASLLRVRPNSRVFVAHSLDRGVFAPPGESPGKVGGVVVVLRLDRTPPRMLGLAGPPLRCRHATQTSGWSPGAGRG